MLSIEHHPIDQLRRLFGEGDRHGPAERVADDLSVADPELSQGLGDEIRLVFDRVAGGRLFRAAVAEQVDRDDAVIAIEQRDHLVPPVDRAGEAVDEDDRAALSLARVRPPRVRRPAASGSARPVRSPRPTSFRGRRSARSARAGPRARRPPRSGSSSLSASGVTLAGTHGEIRHPGRRAALRRADRRRQQERGPADPRRLPAHRGGAAAPAGAADSRHRSADRDPRAARGRGRVDGGQQRPALRGQRQRRRRR